ncbi:MAG: hypothetical protein P8J33_09045 [Pirellulaceae bacterium]|nr:hypothetical protein [Pirellulaceae bacterium]
MPIRVTCPGCHTRFNVSEKFSGKEGPCPKCKKTITIPSASEAVEVHAPEGFGPKTTVGKAVFQPIQRKDTRLSPVQMVLIGATIVGFLAVAFLLRSGIENKADVSSWILLLGSVLLAIPCVYAGYSFLGNSELGKLEGQELWLRVLLCSIAYGLVWLTIYLVSYAVGPELGMFVGLALMIALGAGAAYLFLQLDYLMAILHYGLFLGVSIMLRTVAGFTAMPYVEPTGSSIDDILNAQRQTIGLAQLVMDICQPLI